MLRQLIKSIREKGGSPVKFCRAKMHVTKGFLDTIAVDLSTKIFATARGDILKSALRVKTGAGFFQRCVIQIGGKT